jgi:hypothetical protein
LFDQIMDLPLPQIYGAVWRSDITEVRRRSSDIQDVRGRTPGAREQGVATSVKELELVDAEGDRGLVEVPVADGAARGLRPGGGARGPWAGKGPVAGGGTMGTRAGGGATHTYHDFKKSFITHPWLLNMPKIISIPLNIIYE